MTNVTDEKPKFYYEKKSVSQEQLQQEHDYIMAQKILKSMLENDLITAIEFNKITKLNRQSFSPALAPIMPEKR